MRVMAYLATLVLLFALWGGWLMYRHRLDKAKWFLLIAPWFVIVPFLMNTAGWMLTENGQWLGQVFHKASAAAIFMGWYVPSTTPSSLPTNMAIGVARRRTTKEMTAVR